MIKRRKKSAATKAKIANKIATDGKARAKANKQKTTLSKLKAGVKKAKVIFAKNIKWGDAMKQAFKK
jgi:hypothetical protein